MSKLLRCSCLTLALWLVGCYQSLSAVSSDAESDLPGVESSAPPDIAAPDLPVPTEMPQAPDVPPPSDAPGVPLRLLSPLSTSTVSSRRPTLRWQLATGSEGARIEICRDRECSMLEQSLVVTGARVRLSTELSRGVHFWRARERRGGSDGAELSATWEIFVGARSAPIDSSWGSVADFNGDGYAEVAVGAPSVREGTGRVHVYFGRAAGPAAIPTVSLTGPDGTRGEFGNAAASAGDVNGDGFADLAVSAPRVMSSRGRVYVYLGSALGLSPLAAYTLTGPEGRNAGFSGAVASAGDVNADGYADLAVGAEGGSGPLGQVMVYLGSAQGLSARASTVLDSPDGPLGGFGHSVASIGDADGDGFADLAVGSYYALEQRGIVHVYPGSVMGLAAAPTRSINTPTQSVLFGYTVAGAGDVNGDGYADLAVGAYWNSGGSDTNTGWVHLYPGSVTGIVTAPSESFMAPRFSEGRFGVAVAGVGDVNGDGYADYALGQSHGRDSIGNVCVYFGHAAGSGAPPCASYNGPDGPQGGFGRSVASAGDLNGDGTSDLVVGAMAVMSYQGRVHIFYGSPAGLSPSPSLSLTGIDGTNGYFGWSLASRWLAWTWPVG